MAKRASKARKPTVVWTAAHLDLPLGEICAIHLPSCPDDLPLWMTVPTVEADKNNIQERLVQVKNGAGKVDWVQCA